MVLALRLQLALLRLAWAQRQSAQVARLHRTLRLSVTRRQELSSHQEVSGKSINTPLL